jgi:hypothetical protein
LWLISVKHLPSTNYNVPFLQLREECDGESDSASESSERASSYYKPGSRNSVIVAIEDFEVQTTLYCLVSKYYLNSNNKLIV